MLPLTVVCHYVSIYAPVRRAIHHGWVRRRTVRRVIKLLKAGSVIAPIAAASPSVILVCEQVPAWLINPAPPAPDYAPPAPVRYGMLPPDLYSFSPGDGQVVEQTVIPEQGDCLLFGFATAIVFFLKRNRNYGEAKEK